VVAISSVEDLAAEGRTHDEASVGEAGEFALYGADAGFDLAGDLAVKKDSSGAPRRSARIWPRVWPRSRSPRDGVAVLILSTLVLKMSTGGSREPEAFGGGRDQS
jgi:hypothetical protein